MGLPLWGRLFQAPSRLAVAFARRGACVASGEAFRSIETKVTKPLPGARSAGAICEFKGTACCWGYHLSGSFRHGLCSQGPELEDVAPTLRVRGASCLRAFLLSLKGRQTEDAAFLPSAAVERRKAAVTSEASHLGKLSQCHGPATRGVLPGPRGLGGEALGGGSIPDSAGRPHHVVSARLFGSEPTVDGQNPAPPGVMIPR